MKVVVSGLGNVALTELSLDDATWVEATAGLAARTHLLVQNTSGNGGTVLWAYSDSATTGVQITDGSSRAVILQRSTLVRVYVKMLDGTGTVVVEELAP
jgi:hypothetical protein